MGDSFLAVEVLDNGLGARVDAQFLVDVGNITLQRADTDVQVACDFLVTVALGQLAENVLLARSQRGEGRQGCGYLLKVLHHPPGHLRRHGRATGANLPDRTQKFVRSEESRVGKECRSRWSPY